MSHVNDDECKEMSFRSRRNHKMLLLVHVEIISSNCGQHILHGHSPDILALWENILNSSIPSSEFLVLGYLHLFGRILVFTCMTLVFIFRSILNWLEKSLLKLQTVLTCASTLSTKVSQLFIVLSFLFLS